MKLGFVVLHCRHFVCNGDKNIAFMHPMTCITQCCALIHRFFRAEGSKKDAVSVPKSKKSKIMVNDLDSDQDFEVGCTNPKR